MRIAPIHSTPIFSLVSSFSVPLQNQLSTGTLTLSHSFTPPASALPVASVTQKMPPPELTTETATTKKKEVVLIDG
jgi:hypothetical protein